MNKANTKRVERFHAIGCMACRLLGWFTPGYDVHHLVDKGTRKASGGDKATIPLCPYHHRGLLADGFSVGDMERLFGPSLATKKKAFIAEFGTERELLEKVDRLITGAERRATAIEGRT